MASFVKHTTPIHFAMVVFIATIAIPSLSSSLEGVNTISAAPALLPEAPMSVPLPPELAPDISPLLPSPRGVAPSPGDLMPTIPSNRSPPNPDALAGPGPNTEVSPSGSVTSLAPSSSSPVSVAAPLSSDGSIAALCYGLVLFCLLHLVGGAE
eukprot:TRINITY_DN3569_c0_g1_i1.p1 TRINITY_DN3569_c0_g1~~TRINITY_DN3569_c0_g1_i1.p1  ORF type:complete len:153 (+),score=24.74 TRINITY_DN3569_c0_g1_i1:198-656(+)